MFAEKPAGEEIDIEAEVERYREARLQRLANAIRPHTTRLHHRLDAAADFPAAEIDSVIVPPPPVHGPIGKVALGSELA